jgi:Xaa-Pro aminopeptidase
MDAHIASIQQALRLENLDGWLFFDHHLRDPLAYRVLRFSPAQSVSRRWYYFVPAQGDPVALVHKIEPRVLDPLPGEKRPYAGWLQQRDALAALLSGVKTIAMQYSPLCAVPYVSNVDAGTIELIRATGVEVRSAANLIQLFEARWSQEQYDSHKAAQRKVDAIRAAAFQKVSDALAAHSPISELDIQHFILNAFQTEGLFTDHGPIVAVNSNASNPHYNPTPESHSPILPGDLLLIDLWAKLNQPSAVYYDITWTAFCGPQPPDEMLNVFAAVSGARDAAVACVQSAAARGRELHGFEVDDACRNFLRARSLADHFFHRTGHSIGEDVHGNGANMDNYETHDDRLVIPRTCFSVEPGVYLPAFGIRSEVNVYRSEAAAEVTGEIQSALLRL